MKTALISWMLPTTRQEGAPLPVGEIQDVTIKLSADGGANFSDVGVFTPDVLEVPVADLPSSDQYVVRGFATDTAGKGGSVIDVPFVIADDSPPGDLEISIALS